MVQPGVNRSAQRRRRWVLAALRPVRLVSCAEEEAEKIGEPNPNLEPVVVPKPRSTRGSLSPRCVSQVYISVKLRAPGDDFSSNHVPKWESRSKQVNPPLAHHAQFSVPGQAPQGYR